jgi:glucosylglycerate synthase
MAASPTNAAVTSEATSPSASLLIHLAPLAPEALETTLSNLALAFPSQSVLVALPEAANLTPQSSFNTLRLLPYSPSSAAASTTRTLTAIDFVNTWKLAHENSASACVLLGAESNSLQPESIRAFASAVSASDLNVGRYHLGANEGLFNSAITYPLTRAVFGARPRFPLALDLGLSTRMAERLATVGQRFTAAGQEDALLWPTAEAAAGSFTSAEIDVPSRTFPQPPAADLNTVLSQIAGSLFSEIEAKATFWQRVRNSPPSRVSKLVPAPIDGLPDVAPMLDSFHLAYSNLHELWSLVLPPQSLLGLKHLTLLPASDFRMPDSLWARTIYDFALAYRLRTINRGHLLGALTPLYLAWIASHLTLIRNGTPPEKHIEELAQVFETDKPYFVSRWRWPDRFNP